MNGKSEENGREDEVTRRDTHPNATQQTQTTEEQIAIPNQEAESVYKNCKSCCHQIRLSLEAQQHFGFVKR
jgi:hypothetical protein